MVSFLGLMDTVKLKPKVKSDSKELQMTQYMLKMLTILTNILVTNLANLELQHPDEIHVSSFISQVVNSLTQKRCPDIKLGLNALSAAIQTASVGDSDEKNASNYGCSLLKELAFKFLTYAQDEVPDQRLRYLLLAEYATIIKQ